MLVQYLALLLGLWTTYIAANTEKVIFTAPKAQDFPTDASLDNLLLDRLSIADLSIRTYINASFPTDDQPKGTETWLILENLTPGQRYEVRVCWLATQPTEFWLYTHEMQTTFETPELISSLSLYSSSRHKTVSSDKLEDARSRARSRKRSSFATTFLFLQIHAAADYYSLNKTLMENVPPVHVDIILDPYLLNILPQSLLPTVAYILVVAVIGWFAAGLIYRHFVLPHSGIDKGVESKKSK
jgi:hypothetical protein